MSISAGLHLLPCEYHCIIILSYKVKQNVQLNHQKCACVEMAHLKAFQMLLCSLFCHTPSFFQNYGKVVTLHTRCINSALLVPPHTIDFLFLSLSFYCL